VTYISHTIDTISSNSVDYTEERKNEKSKISAASARKLVNRDVVLDSKNGLLYVISNLKADNETATSFRKNNVIDIYNIYNGKYLNSFYIPKQFEQTIKSLIIQDQFIIVLYKEYMEIMTLVDSFYLVNQMSI